MGEDFGEGLGEAEGEEADEGEDEAEGEGEDLSFVGAAVGLAEGVGDAFCKGFTGPVGLRGGPGFAVGVGVGEGAAKISETPRQSGSAKMKRRNLMGAAAARQP